MRSIPEYRQIICEITETMCEYKDGHLGIDPQMHASLRKLAPVAKKCL